MPCTLKIIYTRNIGIIMSMQRKDIYALLLMAGLAAICVSLWWSWGVLAAYIQPRTPTEKKDLVNVFVLIAAGVVGAFTAIAALGNLYMSRRNLRQQRDLDERRAQDDALQAYYKQMGDLVTEHHLKQKKPNADVAFLARAQTLTVLRRLDARRKGDLTLLLYGAGLIHKDSSIVNLGGADLHDADLSGADLGAARLGVTRLSRANLRGTFLGSANLVAALLILGIRLINLGVRLSIRV
jgi:hypothetical protein